MCQLTLPIPAAAAAGFKKRLLRLRRQKPVPTALGKMKLSAPTVLPVFHCRSTLTRSFVIGRMRTRDVVFGVETSPSYKPSSTMIACLCQSILPQRRASTSPIRIPVRRMRITAVRHGSWSFPRRAFTSSDVSARRSRTERLAGWGNSSDGVRLQVAPSDRGPKARTQSCGHTAHGLGSEFGKQAQKTLHLFRPDVL